MKKSSLCSMALVMLVSILSFSSCNKVEVNEQVPVSPEEYTVSIGYAGEIGEITESPLAKAEAGKDLYMIQVLSCPDGQNTYINYAKGLFDDTARMTIKLIKGYKYKFLSSMVVDGKEKIQSYDQGTDTLRFNYPLNSALTNAFTYTSSSYFDSIHTGYLNMSKDNNAYWRPNTDRYYGEVTDYVPTAGGTVSIFMKRTAFGAKFVAPELKAGKLSIRMQESPEMSIQAPSTFVEDIFAFHEIAYAYRSKGLYSEAVAVSVAYTGTDGVEVPLGSKTIEFKRNKLTTVNIKLKEGSTSTDTRIFISLETDPMGEGDNVEIGYDDTIIK